MRVSGGLILAALLAAGMAQAQSMTQTPAQISVTGEATITATPDLATVGLGVTTTDVAAGAAMKANSSALAAVIERLKAAGIEDRDMQTASLQLNPNLTHFENGNPPKVSGYTASNMLSVRVRDLKILGGVLDAVVTDGVNTLNDISFGHVDAKPLEDAARKAAVTDAIERAKLLTEAAGIKLGRIVSMTDSTASSGPLPMFKSVSMADSVPMAEGEVGVTAIVNIVFELLP